MSQYVAPGSQRAGQGQYVPPPPPLLQQQQPQTQYIPPPPPRMPMSATNAHPPYLPPPPQSQPYGTWNRQPVFSSPPAQTQQREPQMYDPSLYYEYTMPPLPPENQPLTSATYIPDGVSFGPGVGIPALHQPSRPTPQDPYARFYRQPEFSSSGHDLSMARQGGDGTYNQDHAQTWFGTSPYQHIAQMQSAPPPPQSSLPPPTPTTGPRQEKRLILPAKETEQHMSPADAIRPPFSHHHAQGNDSPSNRDHSSSGEVPGSPSDHNWTPERVQAWLTAHGFSNEWKAAFQHLQIHGSQFLDIGKRGGQRNIGLMPQTILPQVTRECTANGVVWDQSKERDEGKRMRILLRDVVKNGGVATPASTTTSAPRIGRRDSRSHPDLPSAGTDPGGVESSPNLSRSDPTFVGSTPTTADGGDDSPNRAIPAGLQGKPSGQRLVAQDSLTSTFNDTERSAFSRKALGSMNEIRRQHSPNSSTGDLSTSSQKVQASPHHSPGIMNARPLSNGTGHTRFPSGTSHLRGPSSDNIPIISDYQNDRRVGQDGSRPPPGESNGRQGSRDTPMSAREHKSSLWSKFRRDRKKDDHTALDEEHGPASPYAPRQDLYGKPGAASSDISLESFGRQHHASVDSTDNIPGMSRGRPTARDGDKKFVFVTPDGWNYRLIDITEVETADQLRSVICFNLGIANGPDVSLHMTSPGRVDHDDGLNDQGLMSMRSRMADPGGNLKLFVRSPYTVAEPPESAGFGISAMPPSPFNRPRFGSKTMDDGTTRRTQEDQAYSPSALTSRSDTSSAVIDRLKQMQILPKDHEPSGGDVRATLQEHMLQRDFQKLPYDQQQALLEARAAQHRKETERKQQFYQAQRRSQIIESKDGKKVHNFDSRRSPYELERTASTRPVSSGSDFEKSFQPMRRAPPVPEPTTTLAKANSLTKKGSVSARTSWPNRKEEQIKRMSNGSIPEEDGKKGSPNKSGNGAGSVPATSSGLQKSMTAPDLVNGDEGAVGTNRGFTGANLGQGATSSGSRVSPNTPRSPFTMSRGGQAFRVPEYVEPEEDDEDTLKASQRPQLQILTAPNQAMANYQSEAGRPRSPDLSPSSSHPQAPLTRMVSKRGPNFDVPTYEADFAPSPNIGVHSDYDSDEDSDDGLFAIPLAKQKEKMDIEIDTDVDNDALEREIMGGGKGQRVPSQAKAKAILGVTGAASPNRSPIRPELPKLKTSKQHVKFDSPKNQTLSKFGDGDDADNVTFGTQSTSSANPWSTDSPDESARFGRRESFASDIWANRPPVEDIAERLDNFFPNVDLDQPVGETGEHAEGSTSPMSAEKSSTGTLASSTEPSSRGTITPASSVEETLNILSSEESTLKAGVASVAERSLQKSAGGLGRTKSIRDKVKNNYSHLTGLSNHPSGSSTYSSRQPSMSGLSGMPVMPVMPAPISNRISTLRSDIGIGRRKSTKMFGAKIEQVKINRGSRLITNLEPIQDTIPAGNVHHTKPERQPTFKWMRGQLIGKGTFGRVYLGMNTTTGELLAVKQVEVKPKAGNADPAEMVKALDQEIDTMQHLDHVNIVQYLGCERKEYSISIFLEYISGGSVGSCLRKHGKFEEPVVSSLTRQTLGGLAYLHSEGILHRDLKADNILLDLDGTCKISDFGISKRSANPYNNDITNSMQGSVFWMAPEVIRAQSQALTSSGGDGLDPNSMNKGYSAKVDIWSLGCVVLEMFAGRRPWSKEEAIGAIYKLGSLNQAPPIPDDVSTVVGPAALSFMYDCFTIDPGERPTADTLLRAPFCHFDPHYNFLDTDLYAKIRGAF